MNIIVCFGSEAEVSPGQMFSNDGSATVESLYEMGPTATWQSKVTGILISDHQIETKTSATHQIKVMNVNFHQEFSL